MPSDHHAACDRCGGQAIFRLATDPRVDYPASRIYVCEGCGNVIWLKVPSGQQQQQQIKSEPQGGDPETEAEYSKLARAWLNLHEEPVEATKPVLQQQQPQPKKPDDES